MISHQKKTLKASQNVIAWCAANPGLVPPAEGSPASWLPLTRQYQALTQVADDLTDAEREQKVQYDATKLASNEEPELRKHLRDELRVVTGIAQSLRKEVPGIGILKMPGSSGPSEALLRSAFALTKQVKVYESVLVEHGLVPDFIARLEDAMKQLKASVLGRSVAAGARVRATQQVKSSATIAAAYMTRMDAQLSNLLKGQKPQLAEWKTARRLTSRPVYRQDAAKPASELLAAPASVPMLVAATAAPAEAKAA